MTEQTNLPRNSHITLDVLLCACSIFNIHRGVLGTTVNPDTCPIRMDANFFRSATKNMRIQKYPDMCGRGLRPGSKVQHLGLMS